MNQKLDYMGTCQNLKKATLTNQIGLNLFYQKS